MKILVIRSSNPYARPSASHNRFITLAEGLIEKGCTIEMVFTKLVVNKSEIKKFGFAGYHQGMNYKYVVQQDCSNVFKRQLYSKLLGRDSTITRKLMLIISKKDYDYIWLDFSTQIVKLGLRIFKFDKIRNKKFFHERSEFSWIGLKDKNNLHQKYLTEFLPRIDLMSVMTKTLGEYYRTYLNPQAKMIHLPMTVDLSRFENVKTNNTLSKPYIAYCGTMNNQKDGVDILIQSFIRIKDEFPELHLYLAGPLKPEKDYTQQKEIIKNAKAENRITYLGMLSVEEMPIFLSNAKVLALARPESKQAEGGFPTKLGEYLATGNPVCVTKVGEIPNYLINQESAYLAEPGSVESFASVLKLALTDFNVSRIGFEGKQVSWKFFNKNIQSELLMNSFQSK